MIRLCLLTLLVGLIVGSVSGCTRSAGSVLGADPGTTATTRIDRLKPGAQVTVSGTMIEKCPTAGCWFMLMDGTGVVRVDTKTAGFTVTGVAVNTPVTVVGTVKNGAERLLIARGMRF